MPSKTTLLFDLGGVIVPWVGIEALMEHTGQTRAAILKEFETRPIFSDYEIGQCSDDIFIDELTRVFDLGIKSDDAKRLWQNWVKAPYDGTREVLETLKQTYNTACLSNTNSLHWSRLEDILPLGPSFHHAFASHILGAAKPHARCYQLALENMGASPESTIFFDDTQANIDTAAALGMEAHLVDRAVGVIPTLEKLALI